MRLTIILVAVAPYRGVLASSPTPAEPPGQARTGQRGDDEATLDQPARRAGG